MTNRDEIRVAAGTAAELLPVALATLGELTSSCSQANVRMGAARILIDAALKLTEAADPDNAAALAQLDEELQQFKLEVMEEAD